MMSAMVLDDGIKQPLLLSLAVTSSDTQIDCKIRANLKTAVCRPEAAHHCVLVSAVSFSSCVYVSLGAVTLLKAGLATQNQIASIRIPVVSQDTG